MISGFRREVDENRALLGYYAPEVVISYRRFGITYQSHLQGLKIQKDGTETSHNNPEEHSYKYTVLSSPA